jgi:hypothetical protein
VKKVRVLPVQAKKAYIRNRGKIPLNLNLGSGEEDCSAHALGVLPRERTPVPIK